MRVRVTLAMLITVAGTALSFALTPPHYVARTTFSPPAESTLPGGKFGELVRQGERIFHDTPKYAGRYDGNALSCGSCHLDRGRRPDAIPMWGSAGMYPQFRSRSQQVITLGQRLQQCFIYSLNGTAPTRDSQTLLALEAYIAWLGTGAPMQTLLPGAGLPVLPKTPRQADPVAGRTIYTNQCASCHGSAGQGQPGAVPPLWGSSSYPSGAGLSRPSVLARYVWATMPYNSIQTLTPQQSRDVAAWVDLQVRPPNPRKGLLGWLP